MAWLEKVLSRLSDIFLFFGSLSVGESLVWKSCRQNHVSLVAIPGFKRNWR